MSSWRDNASQQAQRDLDDLLNIALPFAQQMLDKHGEFFPYATVLEQNGSPKMVAADPGTGEQPDSTDVLALLLDGVRADRDGIRAAALVSDVRLSDTDAVRVELEHREGHALSVFLPYKPKRLRRGVDYGELEAASGTPRIWTE